MTACSLEKVAETYLNFSTKRVALVHTLYTLLIEISRALLTPSTTFPLKIK